MLQRGAGSVVEGCVEVEGAMEGSVSLTWYVVAFLTYTRRGRCERRKNNELHLVIH